MHQKNTKNGFFFLEKRISKNIILVIISLIILKIIEVNLNHYKQFFLILINNSTKLLNISNGQKMRTSIHFASTISNIIS